MSEHAYFSRYNTAEFDEPFYNGRPQRVLIIAFTPRVGSTLLVRGLMSIDAIAASTEYFHPVHRADFEARWGTLSDQAYLEKLMQYRTKTNGLFAVKAHYTHFTLYAPYLESYNLHFISVQRKDRVRQAVSLFKAVNTKAWSSEMAPYKELTESEYDFCTIRDNIEYINSLYEQWEEYYSKNSYMQKRIYYEDMDNDYRGVLFDTANNFLGMSVCRDSIPAPSLKQQRDALTEYYVARFYANLEQNQADNQLPRLGRLQAWYEKFLVRIKSILSARQHDM